MREGKEFAHARANSQKILDFVTSMHAAKARKKQIVLTCVIAQSQTLPMISA